MERLTSDYNNYVNNIQTKWDVIDRLERQRKQLDDSLTEYYDRMEHRQDVDMDRYYRIVLKIQDIDSDLRVLYSQDFDNELADPYVYKPDPFAVNDTKPEPIEYEIPAWLDESIMCETLRRGG